MIIIDLVVMNNLLSEIMLKRLEGEIFGIVLYWLNDDEFPTQHFH